ncbi:hypothetical protein BN1708_009072 [Verticillium longisporum]|uniref:Initiator tRNA phosphoribosyl transferase n=1 Tax=Verticillium longisporum TaxID=100787 RepID=A0A0G4KDG1_VERLO|nr:hypothetical protein BN1708_009072 [Verticillium longisporum]
MTTKTEKLQTMTSLSEIVFPSASEQPNFSHLLTELKRGDLSISNRLRSIVHDADFVREVAAAFGSVEENPTEATGTVTPSRPLVANERCGSWYIPPSTKSASAYFKSTDGHDNAWKFSTRRLNLHLLEIIGRCDGCIIVDSTRRGKRIPDALSKTIPIWCAVLNRALFPSLPEEAHALHTPPNVVSPSEHAQIAALLPYFLAAFLALDLDLAPLRAQLTKPLRPLWITPDTPLLRPQTTTTPAAPRSTVFEDAHPVICCTASRRVAGGELREGGYVYVQGAGDDTENWACGLTAELFWAHADQLLDTPEGELPALVRGLVDACEPSRGAGAKKVAPSVAVCALAGVEDGEDRRCTLRAQLTKPLRPLWITPDTPLLLPQTTTTAAGPRGTVFEDAHPVICCTALRRVAGGELREGGYVYVQGAGDDTENWACGLTAELFWAHADQLLDTPEGELPALVRGLVDACEPSRGAGAKKVAPSVAVCALAGVEDGEDRRCTVKLIPAITEKQTWIVKAPTEMEVGVGKHKVASRNLRAALPDICGFVTRFLESQKKDDGSLAEGTTVLVACETGKDLSGAGDDTENWACGLTAELFWAHVDQLLGTPEGELPALVRGLVDACEPSRGAGAKKVAPSVAVCALAGVEDGEGRRCTVKLTPAVTEKETWIVKAPTEMEVGVGKHKVASRNLRAALPDICGFVTRFLESQKKDDGSLAEGTTVLVACETGKDLSVAVALAICLWCFDQQDNYRAPDTKTIFNKDMVRHRLGSIMTACPEANPGRASLQSVNSFLMDYRR